MLWLNQWVGNWGREVGEKGDTGEAGSVVTGGFGMEEKDGRAGL